MNPVFSVSEGMQATAVPEAGRAGDGGGVERCAWVHRNTNDTKERA